MRATARVCRLVDDRVGDYLQVLKDLFPHTGRAWKTFRCLKRFLLNLGKTIQLRGHSRRAVIIR